jgi:hypothetical protein
VLPKPRKTLVDYITLGDYKPISLLNYRIKKVIKVVVTKRIIEAIETYSVLLEK